MILDRIDNLVLDSDEGGWYLIASGERNEYVLRLTLPAVRLLWSGAQALGLYLEEAEELADAVACARRYFAGRDAADDAYALRDPHHPQHHEVFADLTEEGT